MCEVFLFVFLFFFVFVSVLFLFFSFYLGTIYVTNINYGIFNIRKYS